MIYIFAADKVCPATECEEAKIGLKNIEMFEGRVRTVIIARNREEAWAKVKDKFADYSAKNNIKIINIGLLEETENKIKAERTAANMTQQQLADASGVNIRQIQRFENGTSDTGNITLKNAVAIAKVLNIAPEDLL